MHEHRPGHGRSEAVHILLFPKYEALRDEEYLLAEWTKLREVREAVLKALEDARRSGLIGNSLEARVILRAAGDAASLLRRHEDDLRYIFIVSQIEIEDTPGTGGDLRIEVLKADGPKCERCWNYSIEVGKDSTYPSLCERCVPAVQEITNDE